MRWRRAGVLVFMMGLVMLTGCDRQTPFAKEADNGAAELAAAATTLTYFHEGKLTRRYAQSSFINFQQVLEDFDQQLATLDGAPPESQLHQLLALYQSAAQAITMPCLSGECDWHKQVDALNQASEALRQASGG